MFPTTDTLVQPLRKVLDKFSLVRSATEAICKPLAIEDYIPQPIVDVSPPKWHLAHSTWFFEIFVLKTFYPGYKAFDPVYNELFNSYYNTIGNRTARNRRGFLSRPTVAEVYAYRAHVNEHVAKLESFITEKNEQEICTLIETGCQHEQQHQELLITDLKYILSCNIIRPTYHTVSIPDQTHTIKSAFLPVSEGMYQIGYAGDEFCFDNELGVHQVFLTEFRIQNRLVTNGEYMEFMADGGYKDFRLWLSEGWDLVNKEQWQHPLYWEQKDGEWYEFSLAGEHKVNKQAPVCHVSFFEAAAYAAWAGKRLLTEFEWEVAARLYNPELKVQNSQDHWIFQPVTTSENQPACQQLFGETWQWTNSAYLPYPGFAIAEGALGEYNGKFMMNQMILRGSSCATPYNHMRHTYRNFFPANAQWQFSGIRLAE
ncbi:ergothioneine biosynthesis protein EgtB [Rhodocytophaga rosea]|uniref:Ergothioneine biosynthesis protein EgtB n=1 Tax=Rhodocytophaga rosea TaxID=2704465 RepID=A0A6C0GNC8_9BACT|nr:ergothioneine biosynthesis protein EgtB [Rhodocytophaga rosea]QHT69548.1 ergothioneine biosynthesis protein EgtB [Rhodocytophaga rosea]